MKKHFILFYARLGPAGLSPFAPGTCGSLLAILLAPFLFMPLPFWGRVMLLIVVFWTGTLAATRAEKILNKEDPSEVVIDELLGQWLACLPFASLSLAGYALAFILFRLFDITKPKPVKMAESLPTGLGIMADDAVAGVIAALLLWGLHVLLPQAELASVFQWITH